MRIPKNKEMTAQVILEIVIPTYNRADILSSTLKEISAAIGTLEENVLLRVIDNCSTDHTIEVVRPYLDANCLVYEKNSSNIGLINNIAKCINTSAARWVWVFGDDDHIILHSLPFLLKALSSLSDDIVFAKALSLKVTEEGFTTGVVQLDHKPNSSILQYDPGVSIAWKSSIHGLAFISTLFINPFHWNQDYHDSIYDDNDLYTFVLTLLHACINKKSVDLNIHVVAATDRGDRSYYTPKMCVARLTEYTSFEQIIHDALGRPVARRILSRGRKNLLILRLTSCIKLIGYKTSYRIGGADPISFMSSYRSPYLRDVIAIRLIGVLGRLPLTQQACKTLYDFLRERYT